MAINRRTCLAAGLAGAAAAPLFIRHARAADVLRFAHGIASGQPQADTVVLWTMLTGAELPPEVSVAWELAEDEAFTRIAARGEELARAADLHSVHAEPAGLKPARGYFYRFRALGQQSPVGRTRTAPAPGAAVDRLSFTITSCQRWDTGHWAAWRDVVAQAPELVMFLGDYIYEYGTNQGAADAPRRHEGGKVRNLAGYRARYAQYKSDPALQAAHAFAPWLLVWDDHEVDNDYANVQGQDLQFDFAAQRAAAYQAYWEFMPLSKAQKPVNGSMRMHGRLDWGRLARIHLLDDRQMRDVQVCPRPGRGGSAEPRLDACPALLDPKRTLLGAEQERWLAEGWSFEQPWNLLAQQTLMARCSWEPLAEHGGRYWTDGWDGYPAARERLLAVVAERKVPGVVALGGDVHANYVAQLKPGGYAAWDDPKTPVVASEFCGTSISSLGLPPERMEVARQVNPHLLHARSDQRGHVLFALDRQKLTAELRVVNDARDPASASSVQGRFFVEAGKPGPQRL